MCSGGYAGALEKRGNLVPKLARADDWGAPGTSGGAYKTRIKDGRLLVCVFEGSVPDSEEDDTEVNVLLTAFEYFERETLLGS